jgi:hypothetical protein
METGHLESLFVDGTIISKCIFKTWDEKTWTALIWLRKETGGGRL